MTLCSGQPGWASTRGVKPIWIYWSKRQRVTVASAAPDVNCTLPQTDNHASTPPLSYVTGRMPFLPPNQQRQSTEGIHQNTKGNKNKINIREMTNSQQELVWTLTTCQNAVQHTCVAPGNSRPSAAVSQPPSLSLSRSLSLDTTHMHCIHSRHSRFSMTGHC